MKTRLPSLFIGLLPLLLLLGGCDLDSSDDVVRNVGVDFTGVYTNSGGPIVDRNTGNTVNSLNLRQNGNKLEAVDNNGILFRGSLGRVLDGEASFTLKGSTTAGAEVTISGVLRAEGSTGTLTGTWVESTLFGNVSASASVRGIIEGSGGDSGSGSDGGSGGSTLSLSPSGSVSLVSGASQTFTASDGSGSYTWSISNTAAGTLNRTSGSSVTYTANTSGSQTLTVSDGSTTRTATITQN